MPAALEGEKVLYFFNNNGEKIVVNDWIGKTIEIKKTGVLKCADCQKMVSNDVKMSVVLKAGLYEKLGLVHCGVTRSGFVAVGGDVSTIIDKQVVLFLTHKVAVCRNGDNHIFMFIEG